MLRHPPARIGSVMPKAVQLLKEWGVIVDSIYPDEKLTDVAHINVEHDFYVLKSRTELSLSLAGALHAAGAITLNPYPIAEMMRDKIIATRILSQAGVPIPETFITSQPKKLVSLLDEGPLIVKPFRGSEGRGVHIVWDADALDDIPMNQGPIFVQRFHNPQGRDHKIYYMGGHIFGVRRIWPARTFEQKLGEPFTLSSELHKIALSCSRAFGVELFGLDVIFNEHRPYVVDINGFPGFKGVPNSELRLADYIYTFGQRVLNGEIMPLVVNKKEKVS